MGVFHHLQGGFVSPRRAALYARVSTHDQQTLAMQRDAMHKFATRRGWTIIATVEEIASGAKDRRPKRHALLTAAKQRKLDVILVWKLDRWGRSLVDLMTTLHELTALGVGFVSLTEALDLTTPAGRAFAGFLAVFAEFERDLIRERIKAGITDARKRGKAHGRPRAQANETLLVNSKTPWMATLHPTVEGQRDRSCCVKQCSPMLLEMQWPRLNQQSHNHLYTGGAFSRLYPVSLSVTSNDAEQTKKRSLVSRSEALILQSQYRFPTVGGTPR